MATHRRFQMVCVWAGLAIGLAGCTSTRDDVTFNPYHPTHGDPGLTQSADLLIDSAERAWGDLDLRIEHLLY